MKLSRKTSAVSAATEEVNPTWGIALRIWLAMVWRVLLAMLVGMFLFLLVEYFLFRGQDVEEMRAQFLSLFLLPFAIWSVRAVLNKNFGAYRVSLVKRPPAEKPDAEVDKKRTSAAE